MGVIPLSVGTGLLPDGTQNGGARFMVEQALSAGGFGITYKCRDLQFEDLCVVKELALFADRCDVSEELTRLDSHFEQFAIHLGKNEPVGRTLEFMCQEIGREFNTLGSKANDVEISQLVVTCKAEMEKIREQIQNIE